MLEFASGSDNEKIRNAILNERVNYLGSFEETAISLEKSIITPRKKFRAWKRDKWTEYSPWGRAKKC